jgi:hypothetical protein
MKIKTKIRAGLPPVNGGGAREYPCSTVYKPVYQP